MQLTDYSIEDLKYLLEAVKLRKENMQDFYVQSRVTAKIASMLVFENDIEQAIKDLEFEQQRNNLPF